MLFFIALQREMESIFAMLWKAAGSPSCAQESQSLQQATAVASPANRLQFTTCDEPPVPETRQESGGLVPL